MWHCQVSYANRARKEKGPTPVCRVETVEESYIQLQSNLGIFPNFVAYVVDQGLFLLRDTCGESPIIWHTFRFWDLRRYTRFGGYVSMSPAIIDSVTVLLDMLSQRGIPQESGSCRVNLVIIWELTSQWRPPQQPPHGPHSNFFIMHPPVGPAAAR